MENRLGVFLLGNKSNKIIEMRNEMLKKLRPDIESISHEKSQNKSEVFQNRTLRPVLKFQHDLIIEVFNNYAEKRKGVFYTLSKQKQEEYIKNSLTKDQRFRSLLMGLVVGHLTLEEWKEFEQDSSELTRRTMSMMVARIQDHFN